MSGQHSGSTSRSGATSHSGTTSRSGNTSQTGSTSHSSSKPPPDAVIGIGMNVFVNKEMGLVRYIGKTEFEDGVWLGVELRKPGGWSLREWSYLVILVWKRGGILLVYHCRISSHELSAHYYFLSHLKLKETIVHYLSAKPTIHCLSHICTLPLI